MGQDSSLSIEAGTVIDSDIVIGEHCVVTFRENSRLMNSVFEIGNDSQVDLGKGVIIDSPVSPQSVISTSHGWLKLDERARILSATLLVRFGGKMTIGKYTGIGYGSEIRCEERVEIGAYGMVSYGVCIYDTNTHSTDWRERRKKIEQCYPGGVSEDAKPSTGPVIIGDDVWIGKEASITKGARIGNRCIIGIRTAIGNELVDDDSIVVSGKPRIISRKTETTRRTPVGREY